MPPARAFAVLPEATAISVSMALALQSRSFMQTKARLTLAIVVCSLASMAGAAQAQEETGVPDVAFIEATGAGGFQVGETNYLPSSSSTDFQFPLVYSFGVGGTGGLMLGDTVAFIVNYQYSRGQTRDGSIPGVLDNVEGRIDYHTLLGGLRLYVPTGFGALRGDLAVGVLFPHSTVIQYDYGAGLSQLPTPITGSGFMVENFSVGYGGQARLGYQIPIFGPLYAAVDAALEVYQTENSGETTELTNFVTDFTEQPPVAVDAVILHGDGAARPVASSVSSGRVQLTIGAMF